jgi:glycosyltransferase involved in cell wall biosynthesis
MNSSLTAVIVARDEALMLPGCLDSLKFVDEIVVVIDDRTTDDTAEIARERGCRVIPHSFRDFADIKNVGLDASTCEWSVVVDADERITSALADEIREALGRGADGYWIPTQNVFFGQEMRWGGWSGDYHLRLLRTGAARYAGDIHEQLLFRSPDARTTRLINPIVHLSHRSIRHNVEKTLSYADVQAAEMLRNGAPPVTARRFVSVVVRELWRRLLRGRAWRDGMPGIIEALYQPFSLFVVHVRLWELQQSPSLEQRYADIDRGLRDASD